MVLVLIQWMLAWNVHNLLQQKLYLQNIFYGTEMWECDYDRILVSREEMLIFSEKHPILLRKPLNPRDVLYGGRTESMASFYNVKSNEKIHYVDVCFLYPYICKTGKFPVGHPKVYVSKECRELTGCCASA